jgi:hypothetical protein
MPEEREERVTYLGLLWVVRPSLRWFLEDMLARSKSATSNNCEITTTMGFTRQTTSDRIGRWLPRSRDPVWRRCSCPPLALFFNFPSLKCVKKNIHSYLGSRRTGKDTSAQLQLPLLRHGQPGQQSVLLKSTVLVY